MGNKNRFANAIGKEYNLFAKEYPDFYQFQKKIINFIDFKKNIKLTAVEIGTGTGITTSFFLKRFSNAKIYCIDNEKIMINQTKKNLKDYNSQISLICSDALKYIKSFKKDSVDVFFSGYTLHNFNQSYRKKILKEIFRILKKDGIFINGDKYALDDLKKRHKAFNLEIQNFINVFSKNGTEDVCYDWIIHMSEDENKNKIMTESNSKNVMKKIGFRKISVKYRKNMSAILFAIK